MKIAIIGAGVMGSALALALDRAGNQIHVLGTEFDEAIVSAVRSDGTHPVLHQWIPPNIEFVGAEGWGQALAGADAVFIAVSSAGVRPVVRKASSEISAKAIWAIATKGWDPDSAEPLSKVVEEESPGHPVVVVVGPSIARELATAVPTALVCASRDQVAAKDLAHAMSSESLRTFITDDVAGVEVGAALKNVLAIAVGLCDGLEQAKGTSMINTKAALFSRGLIEMSRLAVALGGRQETILGLAGAGDLFVTQLGGRNGRFGRLVGSGLDPSKAFSEMGTTVEGYENAKEAHLLALKHGLDLAVVSMVHSVLHEGLEPEAALSRLVLAPVEQEI